MRGVFQSRYYLQGLFGARAGNFPARYSGLMPAALTMRA